VWLDPDPPYGFVNHSCDPNLGVRGEREFVALRDISPGDELTVDYAITTDEVHWAMECRCAAPNCRGLIRSVQFLPPEVFARYLPYVNPYFQEVFQQDRPALSTPHESGSQQQTSYGTRHSNGLGDAG